MTTLQILMSKAPLRSRVRVAYAWWRLNHGGPIFRVSTRKVGGLRFIKIGKLTFMFCLSKEYRPL